MDIQESIEKIKQELEIIENKQLMLNMKAHNMFILEELEKNFKKEKLFNLKYPKGLVVIGYQGIGKSSLGGTHNCVDLESSNFWINSEKPKEWAVIYAKQALDIAAQGYTVFTSSHKEVREAFKSLPLPQNVGKVVVFCPDWRYKNEWCIRLHARYDKDPSDKNYRAWKNAEEYFEKNIFDLENDDFPVYTPAYLDYDLWNYVHKMRYDWCGNE